MGKQERKSMENNFILQTERLRIVPFDEAYLEDYYREFTEEVTRYQFPDPFADREAARALVGAFCALMREGEMLELLMLSHEGEFIGSLEVHGLKEEIPELGLWIKASAQGKGYGYEALRAILAWLQRERDIHICAYEADVRNTASLRLARKFRCEERGVEVLTTDSGKELQLMTFLIGLE